MPKNSSTKSRPARPAPTTTATFTLNTFRNAQSKVPITRDLTWAEACAEIEKLTRVQKAKKTALPAFNFCTLAKPYNENDNVTALSSLPIDVDSGSVKSTVEALKAHEIPALVYTSPSHPNADGSDRFRVVVPLAAPMAPAHVKHSRKALAELIGVGPGQGVERADAVSQIFFAGQLNGSDAREFVTIDGEPLDPNRLISARLSQAWGASSAPATVKTLEPVRIEDPDERTAALIGALEPLWEPPATRPGRRDLLRAIGGYLARRGWTDEQIAAVVRALPTARSDEEKLHDVLECARDTRAKDGEGTAGWNAIVQWSPDMAAVIESIARDPEEPPDWRGVWSPAWKALTLGFNRATDPRYSKKVGAPDPGASAFAPPANDHEDGLIWGTLSENPPRQNFLVPELEIGVGRPYGWVGKTNASKTLTLMQLEVDLALGRTIFGQFAGPGKPVPVLRIAYEGFAKAPEDYLRLLRGTGEQLDFAEIGQRLRFAEGRRHFGLTDESREWLLRVTEPFGGGLVVIDPLVAACRGLDENSVEIAQPIYDLESVSKANGVAFIVAHHFGHGAERSRGSSAIDGAFGASASIAKVDGNGRQHHRSVKCAKRNRYGFDDYELVIRDTAERGKPWIPTVEAIRNRETSWAVSVRTTTPTPNGDPKEAAHRDRIDRLVEGLEDLVRDAGAGGMGCTPARSALKINGTVMAEVLKEAKARGHVRQRESYGHASRGIMLDWIEKPEAHRRRGFGPF